MREIDFDSKLPSKQGKYRRDNDTSRAATITSQYQLGFFILEHTACYSTGATCLERRERSCAGSMLYYPSATYENFVKFLFSPPLLEELRKPDFVPDFALVSNFTGKDSPFLFYLLVLFLSLSLSCSLSRLRLSCRRHSRRNFCSVPTFFLLGRFTQREETGKGGRKSKPSTAKTVRIILHKPHI